ncbi:MAG: PUA domain-containing protein [Candidatus Thorarchaeota archaeon]
MRRAKSQNNEHLYRARGIANYQFSDTIGDQLFPDDCEVEISKRSGRLRQILRNSQVLATVRANDGRLVLTIAGAQRLHTLVAFPKLRVIVQQQVASFIGEGRSVFAKHVKDLDPRLRAGDEVLVVDEEDVLLAVGTAHLSPVEILDLSRGVAVKTRHSIKRRAK